MVIHMARTLSLAEQMADALKREGFLVKLSPVYRGVSEAENYYELMVPESEAGEARQVLLDRGLC
jgi:hypothetical protein